MHQIHRLAGLFILATAAACVGGGPTAPAKPAPVPPQVPDTTPPAVRREFRGQWVATVGNIDWPSRPNLTADQQRTELRSLLDNAAAAGMNAVIFHVRPAADAVYRSVIEPWGAMLTGTQGGDPGYDPLAFAVQEAHRRGLELHAWVNPFRAGNSRDSLTLAPMHAFNTQRGMVRVYGTQLWLDPGDPAVQDRVMRVLSDIVQRYDVDGVHMDDYFYPYQQKDAQGRTIDFPDSATYAASGSALPRDDWRRSNSDRFVERANRELHALKPWIRFGVSPFGIWRPNNPPGITGLDAYATLYADARKWLQEGWLDYLAPQLYWAIDPPAQSFPALLDWWMAQSAKGRYVWPGLATYRLYEGTAPWGVSEIVNQVKLVRQRAAGNGVIFYNATTTLSRNGGEVAAALTATVFNDFAVSPAYAWLDAEAPPAPTIGVASGSRGAVAVTLAPAAGEPVRWWVVRWFGGAGWQSQRLWGDTRTVTLTAPNDATVSRVLVQAADRGWNLSPVVEWRAP
ncbi:MAG: glycoside hydrolase family 10 protein [Gemmatimonadaceae bacterium]